MKIRKITIPEGWEIDKIENGEITFKENKKEPNKKEFPKTWEECLLQVCDTEYIDENSTIQEGGYCCCEEYAKKEIPAGLGKPLLALCQLLVCRDVYRGGWKPDYDDDGKWIHAVSVSNDGHIHNISHGNTRRVLSFQSEEICDRFIKNFRDLIEEAKELI